MQLDKKKIISVIAWLDRWISNLSTKGAKKCALTSLQCAVETEKNNFLEKNFSLSLYFQHCQIFSSGLFPQLLSCFHLFLLPSHLSFFEENVVLVKGRQVWGLALIWKGGTAELEGHRHLWKPDQTRDAVPGKDGQPGLGEVILKASTSLQPLRPPLKWLLTN